MSDQERLKHLLYRCLQCKRVLTKYQIMARWERLEASGSSSGNGLCECGGSRVSPTNVSILEELTSPSIWLVWWRDVVRPWLNR